MTVTSFLGSSQVNISPSTVFTRLNNTLCSNYDCYECDPPKMNGEPSLSLNYVNELLTERPTGDLCLDYCLQINCLSFSTSKTSCRFSSVFDSDTYQVVEWTNVNCFVRSTPPVDCSSTSNCTPQLSFCGGTLPDMNFEKADL